MKLYLPFLLIACSGAQKTSDTSISNDTTMDTNPSDATPIINEVLAKSDERDDWIEIYNPTDDAIDLSNFGLVDDYGEDEPWTFPAGSSIGTGEYIIIWANDEDGPDGEYSASFKLSSDGESVHLVDYNGESVLSVEFPALDPEQSYAKIGSDREVTDTPTPGTSNE